MIMGITIFAGYAGDTDKINITWFDENNVLQTTAIEVKVNDEDRLRSLEVIVDGISVVVLGELGV